MVLPQMNMIMVITLLGELLSLGILQRHKRGKMTNQVDTRQPMPHITKVPNTRKIEKTLKQQTMPLVRYLKVTGRYQQKRFGWLWNMPILNRSIGDPREIGPLTKGMEESTEFL